MNRLFSDIRAWQVLSFPLIVVSFNVAWFLLWPSVTRILWPSVASAQITVSLAIQIAIVGLLVPIGASLITYWFYGFWRKSFRVALPILLFCLIAPWSVGAAFDLAGVHPHPMIEKVGLVK